ncbi:hypothetical protein llap_3467 [Limosa lapponica baueri]|uniref:Uncharacterized protein n=1 Tax=Limosa lapponica baueri TaxID=1758121 RepID=A0A2I0UJM3_LIMLA|nr:hypothetical protein llap_3467 [Limosa lapponica baueri]
MAQLQLDRGVRICERNNSADTKGAAALEMEDSNAKNRQNTFKHWEEDSAHESKLYILTNLMKEIVHLSEESAEKVSAHVHTSLVCAEPGTVCECD